MAPYKVPKLIHLIDEIPLTAVGKIDKKILRELSRQT
jgi:long-chain acyl-CoA synthetase